MLNGKTDADGCTAIAAEIAKLDAGLGGPAADAQPALPAEAMSG